MISFITKLFQQLKHIDFHIVLVFGAFCDCMITLFVYCYFGRIATDSFLSMSDIVYESNWLNLCVDLQKDIVVVIGNMNRPLYYHGFGIAILNLETYAKVRFSVFSELNITISLEIFTDFKNGRYLLHGTENYHIQVNGWKHKWILLK